MIEVALFTGVGLLGYILANQYKQEEREKFVPQPPPTIDHIALSQQPKGHNNMVPFLGQESHRVCEMMQIVKF